MDQTDWALGVYEKEICVLRAEIERLRAESSGDAEIIEGWKRAVSSQYAEIERLRAEIETWGSIWDNAEFLAARVDALRDGSATLGRPKAS